jgi:hypothetical protein
MTVSELFNIKSILETVGIYRLPSALSKIYMNMVEFYHDDPSPKQRIYQSLHLPSSRFFALLPSCPS